MKSSFSVSVGLLATAAVYFLGGPAGLVAAVAGTGASLVGAATSGVASFTEGYFEGKQVKSVREKMETLKEHIRDYFLYSNMVDHYISEKLMTETLDACKCILMNGFQLLELLTESGANLLEEIFGIAAVGSIVITFVSTIKNLINECRDLLGGKPTDAITDLSVLKHNLMDIAKGRF